MIGQRTKDALAVRKAQGVKLGGFSAKGVANRKEAKARAEALQPVLAELASKPARAIAAELSARGIATPSGGRWHAETVIRVQRRLEDLSLGSSCHRTRATFGVSMHGLYGLHRRK